MLYIELLIENFIDFIIFLSIGDKIYSFLIIIDFGIKFLITEGIC